MYEETITVVAMTVLVWNPLEAGGDTAEDVATLSLVTGKNGRVVSEIVVSQRDDVDDESDPTADGVVGVAETVR